MGKSIKISIPTPCHEGWDNMTPAERGRFCNSCQKTVVDFTNASDREIARTLQKNSSVCGRLRKNQLDRELIIPAKVNPLRTAAGAAVVSIVTLTATQVQAQTEGLAKTEITIQAIDSTFVMKGVVSDEIGPVPGIYINNKNTGEAVTSDIDGQYSITVHKGDKLVFSLFGYADSALIAMQEAANVQMQPEGEISEGIIITYRKRTFFGRIFHAIGGIFR